MLGDLFHDRSVLLSNFKTIVIIIVPFSPISTWSSWSLHLRHDRAHQSCPILVQVSPDLVPAKVSKLIWNNRRTNKAFPWNKEASQFGTVEEQTKHFLGIIERSNSFFSNLKHYKRVFAQNITKEANLSSFAKFGTKREQNMEQIANKSFPWNKEASQFVFFLNCLLFYLKP